MILLFFSFIFRFFSKIYVEAPPKKINKLEGYRTKKSMKNQSNWEKSQFLMAKSFEKISKSMLLLGVILLIVETFSILTKSWKLFEYLLIIETIVFILACFWVKKNTDNHL